MGKLQVKIIHENTYINCERKINEELASIESNKVRDVKFSSLLAGNEDYFMGMIIFEE